MSRKFSLITPSILRRQSILRRVILGIIGICIVAAGAWRLSNIARLRSNPTPERIATKAPATKAPSTEVPAINKIATQPVASPERILIRWNVGAGTGADAEQVAIDNEVVADFNASQ